MRKYWPFCCCIVCQNHLEIFVVLLKRVTNFRCAFETREKLSDPEILRAKILEEYELRKASDNNAEQNVMYARKIPSRRNMRVSDGRENSKGNKIENYASTEQGKLRCFRCDKIGHIAKKCLAINSQVSA